jgi:hypothetical protein
MVSGRGRYMTGGDYSEAAKDRLWSHRLHEDLILYERHSYFLVTESLVLVAFADLLTDDEQLAAVILAVSGLLLTIAWLWVNRRQRAIIANVHRRACACLPEFQETYRERPPGRPGSGTVLAVYVPAMIAALWAVLLVIAAS